MPGVLRSGVLVRIESDTVCRTHGDAVGMRTDSVPVIHELRVDTESAYRVYEVDRGNLELTCQLLSRREVDGGRTVPLVVSHVPLPSTGSARLPMDVPWLVVSRTFADTLQVLRENLVETILRPALVGVDFADYANALSRGGEIHAWSVRGLDEAECAAGLAGAVECRRVAAACLHIRAPARLGLSPFDETCVSIQRHLPELAGDGCLFVVAATSEERMDVGLSLLIVSGRE